MIKKAVKDKIAKLLDVMVERLNKLSNKLEQYETRLGNIEKMETTLMDRLDKIESRVNLLNPFIQPMQPIQPGSPWNPPVQPFIQSSTCAKCGLNLSSSMGYVCSSPDCPIFSRVTCNSNNTLMDDISTMGDSSTTSMEYKL